MCGGNVYGGVGGRDVKGEKRERGRGKGKGKGDGKGKGEKRGVGLIRER